MRGHGGRQRRTFGGVEERWQSGRGRGEEEGRLEAEGGEGSGPAGRSPRQEARSGPARCPGGQTHSKEPSVLVQMPLWQRSSSLHSSTSAGQDPKPAPPPSPPSQATPPQPSPRPDLPEAPPSHAPPSGGVQPSPFQTRPRLYSRLSSPTPGPTGSAPKVRPESMQNSDSHSGACLFLIQNHPFRVRAQRGTDRGKRLRGVRAGSRGHKCRHRSRRC